MFKFLISLIVYPVFGALMVGCVGSVVWVIVFGSSFGMNIGAYIGAAVGGWYGLTQVAN